MTNEPQDVWSRVRRDWRAASDIYFQMLIEGWDAARTLEQCRRVAGLSIRLRLIEQGRRLVR